MPAFRPGKLTGQHLKGTMTKSSWLLHKNKNPPIQCLTMDSLPQKGQSLLVPVIELLFLERTTGVELKTRRQSLPTPWSGGIGDGGSVAIPCLEHVFCTSSFSFVGVLQASLVASPLIQPRTNGLLSRSVFDSGGSTFASSRQRDLS